MDAFLADAGRILQTARIARQLSPDAGDVSIILHDDGQMRIVSGDGWLLESMAEHYGAATAYRVTQRGGAVVEGLSGVRRCRIGESRANCRWLQNRPRYLLACDPLRLLTAASDG